MKLRNLFLIGLASAVLFAGCKKDEDPTSGTPSISVSPATLEEFTVTGGADNAQTVTLKANRDWIATPSDNWIHVEPSSGAASSNPQTVKVYVDENKSVVRNGSITFSIGFAEEPVAVSQEGADITYATLASVRDLGTGATIPENTIVSVTMISNYELNNLASLKNVYVQDETAGIQIRLTEDNRTYGFGDKLLIDLSGQALSEFSGTLQVNNMPADVITLVEKATEVTPKPVEMAEFLKNTYEGQYVSLSGVQVIEADKDKKFVENNNATSIYFEDEDGNTFEVFSGKYSDALAALEVPDGSGTLEGIAAINNSNIEIILAQLSDVDGLTEERFESQIPAPDPDSEFSSNVTWSLGEKSYSETATINGTEEGVKVLKLGTSSVAGTATFTIPAGTTKIAFYACSWSGKQATVKFSGATLNPAEVSPAPNSGATNSAPYKITVTDSDRYELTVSDVASETTITVSTEGSSNKRVILFGIKAE